MARPDARPALERWVERHGTLIDAAASQPGSTALRGRGRVHVSPRPDDPATGQRWVVRHYHRGGLLARALDDRYLRVGSTRPEREFRLIRALETLGIPTAPAVGAAVYPAGAFYRGDLVTEWVPDSRDLSAYLFPGDAAADAFDGRAGHRPSAAAGAAVAGAATDDAVAAMRAAGVAMRRLHDRGVVHPDLNIRNILVAGGSGGGAGGPLEALILDLDRARIRGRLSDAARRRMLDRFWRSVRKWETRTGLSAPGGARAAFEAGYG